MQLFIGTDYDYPTLALSTTNSDQYRIRSMKESDIDTVFEIDHTTWGEQSWPLKGFFRAFNDPYWDCWILESTTPNHLILGYGFQYFSNDLYVSHIANLCIRPNQRGRGLGGILLHHMINHARRIGASVIELEVNTLNTHAFRLYVRYGFRIIQYLERYYSDTSDAYRMELIINRIKY